MNWRHETWRKLYCREEGTFAQLPLLARAIAGELLKLAGENGVITLGDKSLEEVVSFRLGATRSDRRILRSMLPLLFADGYLIPGEGGVLIRNFEHAQGRPRTGNDRGTTVSRPSNDGVTTGLRPGHEKPPNQAQPLKRPSVVPSVPIRSVPDDQRGSGSEAESPPEKRPRSEPSQKPAEEAKANEPGQIPIKNVHSLTQFFGFWWRQTHRGEWWKPRGKDNEAARELIEDRIGSLPETDRPPALAQIAPAIKRYLANQKDFYVGAGHTLAIFCQDFDGLRGSEQPKPKDTGPVYQRLTPIPMVDENGYRRNDPNARKIGLEILAKQRIAEAAAAGAAVNPPR